MGAIAAAEAALTGVGLTTSLIGRGAQAKAQEEALRLRMEGEEDANIERSTQRAHRLNEVMAEQVAREGASGLSLSSPSFFAVGMDSFNQFAQDENADALNLNFDKLSAFQTEKSIHQQQFFGSMGDVFNAGKFAFDAGAFKSTSGLSGVAQTQEKSVNAGGRPEDKGSPFVINPLTNIFKGTSLDFIL